MQDERALRVGRLHGPGGHIIGGGQALVWFERGLVEREQFVGAQQVREDFKALGTGEDIGAASLLQSGELRGGLVAEPDQGGLGLLPVRLGTVMVRSFSVTVLRLAEASFPRTIRLKSSRHSSHPSPARGFWTSCATSASSRMRLMTVISRRVPAPKLLEEPRPPVDDRLLLALLGGEVVDVADAQRQRPLVGPEPGHTAGKHGLVAEELLRALGGALDAGDGGVVSADSPGAPAALLAGFCSVFAGRPKMLARNHRMPLVGLTSGCSAGSARLLGRCSGFRYGLIFSCPGVGGTVGVVIAKDLSGEVVADEIAEELLRLETLGPPPTPGGNGNEDRED